jgi:hypothetical protein
VVNLKKLENVFTIKVNQPITLVESFKYGYIVYGSELACYKLAYIYKNRFAFIEVVYCNDMESWCFRFHIN